MGPWSVPPEAAERIDWGAGLHSVPQKH